MAKKSKASGAVLTTVKESAGEDLILVIAKHVLTLTGEQAKSEAVTTSDSVAGTYYSLGGILSRIQEEKWYGEWGFGTFNDYVEKELGFSPRKARYLITNFNDLVNSGVCWDDVKDISWSRLSIISGVITKENVADWVQKAKDLNRPSLQAAVAKAKEGTLPKSGSEPPLSTTTTLTFKVHQDQKDSIKQAVDKAKGEAGTEFDGVALEAICLSYLAGSSKTKPSGLKSTMKKAGFMEVLETFETLWPDIDLTIDKIPATETAAGSVEVPETL